MLKRILRKTMPRSVLKSRREYFAYRLWRDRAFAAPAPQEVKWHVLRRNGVAGSTWVETGTFLGDTTLELACHFKEVFTIEPSPQLYTRALNRFRNNRNIKCIHGLSEEVLPTLLPYIEGSVSFWLDGHYSAGETYKGPVDTPIMAELKCIELHMPRLGQVAVLIDDVRCFQPESPEYPPLDILVEWSQKNGLRWHIEHDIFCAIRSQVG